MSPDAINANATMWLTLGLRRERTTKPTLIIRKINGKTIGNLMQKSAAN